MLAALATLTFLVAIWLCAIANAGTLEQSGSKIVAALKGHSSLALPAIRPIEGRVTPRYPASQRPLRARAELRAAA